MTSQAEVAGSGVGVDIETDVDIDTDRRWRSIFEERRGQHHDLLRLSEGIVVDARVRSALCRSLSVFQLGETGTGKHLIAAAQRRKASGDYIAALQCFVKEEQEHARLLALVLADLGWPLRQKHWTDRLFVGMRRLSSLRTEVLTLLVAELIALTYYSRLRDGTSDPTLMDVLGRIHADEVVHVRFHAETFPSHLADLSRPTCQLTKLIWNTTVLVTSILVALDHRPALRAAGVSPPAFIQSVTQDRRALSRRLFGPTPVAVADEGYGFSAG